MVSFSICCALSTFYAPVLFLSHTMCSKGRNLWIQINSNSFLFLFSGQDEWRVSICPLSNKTILKDNTSWDKAIDPELIECKSVFCLGSDGAVHDMSSTIMFFSCLCLFCLAAGKWQMFERNQYSPRLQSTLWCSTEYLLWGWSAAY